MNAAVATAGTVAGTRAAAAEPRQFIVEVLDDHIQSDSSGELELLKLNFEQGNLSAADIKRLHRMVEDAIRTPDHGNGDAFHRADRDRGEIAVVYLQQLAPQRA